MTVFESSSLVQQFLSQNCNLQHIVKWLFFTTKMALSLGHGLHDSS